MAVDLLCLHINLPAQLQVMRIDLFVFRSDIILCDPSGCYSVFICFVGAYLLLRVAWLMPLPSQKLHHLLPEWFYRSGTGLPMVSWKRGCSWVFIYLERVVTQLNGELWMQVS